MFRINTVLRNLIGHQLGKVSLLLSLWSCMIVFSVLLLQRWFHFYYLQNMSVQYLEKCFGARNSHCML